MRLRGNWLGLALLTTASADTTSFDNLPPGSRRRFGWRFRDSDNYYLCRANALENNVVLNGEQLFDDFWFGK